MDVEVPTFEPIAILGVRRSQEKRQLLRQVLVQWKGQTKEEPTWINVMDFQNQFPQFNLEDKVVCQEAGNVMDQTIRKGWVDWKPDSWKVYFRKGKSPEGE